MTTHADILIEDAARQLADFGESGWCYQPACGPARTMAVIVMAQTPTLTDKPRTGLQSIRIQTANAAATGILRSEWTPRDTIAGDAGDGRKTYRIARPLQWDAGLATWELTT